MGRQQWVRCPTSWITESDKLTRFKWGKEGGSAHTSALMCLTAIVHNANQETGIARVNYDHFETITGRSRTSISNGLSVLREFNLIETASTQSEHALVEFDPEEGWGKFPFKALYRHDSILSFGQFGLRSRVELDALKLLYLFVAFRDRHSNLASIGYEKIVVRTGIQRQHIRSALSFLSINNLVYVEKIAKDDDDGYSVNTYRVCGIEPYIHGGTRGRENIAA
jgi:hypothetical protein